MKSPYRKRILVFLAGAFALLLMGSEFDPDEAFNSMMTWKKPEVYPPPMLEGMDIRTLSIMLDSGNLQWYEPRPVQDEWEGVVGLKVHAPAGVVWDVMADHDLQCEIMADTFDYCETLSREGNVVKSFYKIHTSVIMYSYQIEMTEVVKEDPPFHMHIDTVEGGLKGRELNILLVPVNNGAETLLFIRYYATLKGLGAAMRLLISLLPQAEVPTAVSAANYHARAFKNEAEKRAGYKAPARPGPLEIENLDIKTLRRIDELNGGLIRETPEGEFIDALSYTFIDARPERVWEVATDFHHYDDIFRGSESEVELLEGNTVLLHQKTSAFRVLIFSFGQELYSQYALEPPHHLTSTSIKGTHAGTYGELRLMPLEGGTKTLAFAVAGINFENDRGMVARVLQSGAFPLEVIINVLSAQYTLASIRIEAEAREQKAGNSL